MPAETIAKPTLFLSYGREDDEAFVEQSKVRVEKAIF